MNINTIATGNILLASFSTMIMTIDTNLKKISTILSTSFSMLTGWIMMIAACIADDSLTLKGIEVAEEQDRLAPLGNIIALTGLALQIAEMLVTATAATPYIGSILALTLAVTYASIISGVAAFATGGFPETGQYFLAREAGPELVGSIGNRTAVVNNNQIVEEVSVGVYNAFKSAFNNCDSKSQSIARVFLDGRQIAMAGCTA